VITTVPLAGWVTEVMSSGSPSGSLSLASTGMAVAAASSSTSALSSVAVGLSGTQVMPIVTRPTSVPPCPSETV
jgi:hypothetical protein